MTDIVARLRGHPGPDDTVTVQFRTMIEQRHEAAAEIERLQAALDGLLTEVKCFAVDPPSAALNHAIEEAGRALEPKP